MAQPIIGGREPIKVKLEKGETYWWCACGRSQNQPFCDGSHAGCGLVPMEYVAKVSRTMSFCTCKHTKAPPYCDNSHLDLP